MNSFFSATEWSRVCSTVLAYAYYQCVLVRALQRITELEGQVRVQRAEMAQAQLARQQALADSRAQMEQLRAQLESQRKREARLSNLIHIHFSYHIPYLIRLPAPALRTTGEHSLHTECMGMRCTTNIAFMFFQLKG